jgi:hypothetical protein
MADDFENEFYRSLAKVIDDGGFADAGKRKTLGQLVAQLNALYDEEFRLKTELEAIVLANGLSIADFKVYAFPNGAIRVDDKDFHAMAEQFIHRGK